MFLNWLIWTNCWYMSFRWHTTTLTTDENINKYTANTCQGQALSMSDLLVMESFLLACK